MHTGTDLLISVDTGSAPMVKDLEEVTKPYVEESEVLVYPPRHVHNQKVYGAG
jgi:hypothetical protein